MTQKPVSTNKKRRLPPPPPKRSSEGQKTPPPPPKRKAPPVRRAPTLAVKGAEPIEQKVETQPQATEVTKPSQSEPGEKVTVVTATAKRDSATAGPRPTHSGTSTAETERITYAQLKEMPIEDRVALFKKLNVKREGAIIPIVQAAKIPKQMVMRKDEALLREVITSATPPRGKHKLVYYCPYCADYMPFCDEKYTGYDRCMGCSISSKDYYTRVDNQLFNKD